ncbi:hypothetical protein CRE_09488 [Caenorhabditis remanei]|uniref:Uncharacterized protein n=1 Tax=Caenorhabditis remanei TaxID=31234 RepID=E3MJ44_CAERE|nr:hypothetical protein CRE_09488 [Caenorhabditis remanei]
MDGSSLYGPFSRKQGIIIISVFLIICVGVLIGMGLINGGFKCGDNEQSTTVTPAYQPTRTLPRVIIKSVVEENPVSSARDVSTQYEKEPEVRKK